jgi:4-oxalocrotonate tautomerase
VVYDGLVNVAGAPANDKFMIISEHGPGSLVMDPNYVVARSERALVVQITLNAGRTIEVKKNLYRAIADGLHKRIGLPTEDVFINLVEVPKENWSFGRGEASPTGRPPTRCEHGSTGSTRSAWSRASPPRSSVAPSMPAPAPFCSGSSTRPPPTWARSRHRTRPRVDRERAPDIPHPTGPAPGPATQSHAEGRSTAPTGR